jgi:hypothetical protein
VLRVVAILIVGIAHLLVTSGEASAEAASQIDLDGFVVQTNGSELVLDDDGVQLRLNVAEVDPRFLATLRPGDDVRVTAFRLPDGSLLAYSVYYRPDDQPLDRQGAGGPQGGTD